jgi:hypothetical protein
MTEHKNISRVTNCMVGIIQSKTASESDLLPGQRRKQRLHAQHIFGKLCGGIERRPKDLMRENLPLVRDG